MARSKTTCDATRLTTNRPTKRPTRPTDRLTTTPIDLRTKWAAWMHRTKHILLDTWHVCCVCVCVGKEERERGQSGACVWKRPACAKHVRWGKCMCVQFLGQSQGCLVRFLSGLFDCSVALCSCVASLPRMYGNIIMYIYVHACHYTYNAWRPLYVMQAPCVLPHSTTCT